MSTNIDFGAIGGSAKSPRRVHDLELHAGALGLLSKGSASEEELIRRLRAKAKELQRRSAGMGMLPQEAGSTKTLAKSTARETIHELKDFGLVRIEGENVVLTQPGAAVGRSFHLDHSSPTGMLALASLHLTRFAGLRQLLGVLEGASSGLVFVPRPTPTDLGITVVTRDLAAYEAYMEAGAQYAAAELRAWGIEGVRSTSVLKAVRSEAQAKDTSYRKLGMTWSHRIMIDTIRDAMTRFTLGRLVAGVGVVDFEIFCSRGSTLGLLNYSDRVAGAYGRVMFATSWSDRSAAPAWIPSKDLREVRFRELGEPADRLLHAPSWGRIKDRFSRELLAGYERLNREKRSLYVLVADLRDIVSYRLRLSDAQFDHILTRAYNASWDGQGDLRISMDADEVRETRRTQTTKRNPLYLRGLAPRTIVHVARRER